MNFFQRLFSKAASTVARMMTFVPTWARYAFSKVTFQQLVREGYKQNSAVSACATTLQLTFPEPPLLAGYEEDGRFIPDYGHPAMALLQNPNPDMGQSEFMQFAIAYCSIGGNVYIWKQRSVSGKVIALWPFSDAQVQPVAGLDTSEGFVAYYEFMLNGFSDFSGGRQGAGIIIPKADIIHWKWMIDPQFPWKGIGAIELAAREVDKDNEATAYIFALLKNNAVPPVVITLEEGDDSSQDEIDAMGLKWIQKHGKGQPAFISNGMKVEQMGFDLNKLSADTLSDIPESRIAANFHVPPSVAGLNVGIKRSDYGDSAARKAFTEQTLMSLWRLFASEMRNGLSAEYNAPGNFILQFDLRRVGALQEELSKRWERVTLAFNRSMLTRGEAKQELGMVPTAYDDVYFVSLASEFVPAGKAVIRDQSTGSSEVQKTITTKGTKGHEGKANAISRVLLRVRNDVAKRMTATVDVYFSQLADRVVARVEGQKSKADLPGVDELFNADDGKQLETLIKRFYVEVIQLSWNSWNAALGVDVAFDLTDSSVTQALKMAGAHVREIAGTVVDAMVEALTYGNENGWSIDQLVRGDATQRGLRDIIDETYKNQSRAIARSELGQAQNAATAERYKGAGVEKVEILDGGADDSAPACDLANGQIWTVDLFEANSLQHPNCSRAAAPYFGDEDAVTDWPYEFGNRGE
jgi:HK97 family phage portal protein